MIEILDHGSIEILEVMGNDQAIVDAARVSVKNLKPVSSNDKLIEFLLKNKHWSPFEMVEFKFRIRAPIFVAREWVRHRTASWNEVSLRYTVPILDFYLPTVERMNTQSLTNKQGSSTEVIENAKAVRDFIEAYYETSGALYDYLIECGLSRELARIILPVGLYTEWIWKIDLRNLLNFISLRTADGAQWEIRQYADSIMKMINEYVPITMNAWRMYA